MYLSPEVRPLGDIVKKVKHTQRLTKEDGIRILESDDLLAIGHMSNIKRELLNGDKTYFTTDQSIDFADLFSHEKISETKMDELLREKCFAIHGLGTKKHVCMLYGEHRSNEEIIDELIDLRDQQDKSGDFISFLPLVRQSSYENNVDKSNMPTGFEDLKMLAVARLILDNFPHIKALWSMLGIKMLQVSFAFGVDEIAGNIVKNKTKILKGDKNIIQEISCKSLGELIHKAGRKPVEYRADYIILQEGY